MKSSSHEKTRIWRTAARTGCLALADRRVDICSFGADPDSARHAGPFRDFLSPQPAGHGREVEAGLWRQSEPHDLRGRHDGRRT